MWNKTVVILFMIKSIIKEIVGLVITISLFALLSFEPFKIKDISGTRSALLAGIVVTLGILLTLLAGFILNSAYKKIPKINTDAKEILRTFRE